ncbi:MAG TPA: PAS domain-containing protein, partial [Ktedonobacteraceae bacterium]
MTIMQGRKHYAHIMLEHISAGLAVYDAKELCLLEANTLYIHLLDNILAEDWRGGKALGHSMHEWGESVQDEGMINQFQQIIESGQTSHVKEFSVRKPQQEIAYWNTTLQAVQDEQGNISHIIHSVSDISEQVYARQKAERDKLALSQAKQTIEAERKRLEIIEIIARSVQDTLDIKRIGDTTVTTICQQLGSRGASIHTADHDQQILRLLCAKIVSGNAQDQANIQYSSFE